MENTNTIKRSWYQIRGIWFAGIVAAAVGTYFVIDATNSSTTVAPTEAGYVSETYLTVLDAANGYLNYRPYSFDSLTAHLTEQGYEASAISWAMAQINADTDWDAQAIAFGEYLLNYHGYTVDAMYQSIVAEGFTGEQADNAIDILSQ